MKGGQVEDDDLKALQALGGGGGGGRGGPPPKASGPPAANSNFRKAFVPNLPGASSSGPPKRATPARQTES